VWTLVPARLEGEERNWLLLKREEGARVARPERYLPMLATLVDEVPSRGDWLYEVKWDGYRTVARLAEGEAELWSRRGQDLTERFATVAKELGRGVKTFDCVVDGEVCALDDEGRPSFQLLQQGRGRLVYFLFDLLELDGEQLLSRPLRERRRLLEEVVDERTGPIRLSETFPDGAALLEVAREHGLEGVIAKRAGSRYAPGTRSRDWLKVKTRLSEEFLVAGYVRGERARERMGSLVLARRDEDGKLRYAGQVGAGFSEVEIDHVLARLEPLRRETTPFGRVPDDPRLRKKGKVVWAEPRLVAEVDFSEWTDDGRVRAPSFKGLRDDLGPTEEEVRRGSRAVRLTRLDQAWWPDLGIVKADVVDYYRRIAPVLIPHLRDRPFTMKRHYHGPRSPFEWVKDAPPEAPSWIRVSPQPAKSRGGELVRYPLVNDELALLWMIEFGCVDLHVWTSRADRPDRPDVVLFDLDPAGVPFADVVRAARLLRAALDALGLDSYAMTTGGEGIHVRVPIARRHGYEEARGLADVVADALVRSSRGLVTVERALARRHGVFVDTKMNGHGQQIVAPYSVRPLPQAAVATPLRWEEVDEALDPSVFGMRAVLERVEREGDLAEPLLRGRQRLGPALARLA
jgi:bifunctional non-homologous end joining protein LigD